MASNLISRLLPPNNGSPSIYETLQQEDERSETSEIEERAGMTLDEENLQGGYEDFDLDHAQMAEMEASQTAGDSDTSVSSPDRPRRQLRDFATSRPTRTASRRADLTGASPGSNEHEDGDDEVPASLLIEGGEDFPKAVAGANDAPAGRPPRAANAIPGPATREARAQWETTKAQQRLHQETQSGNSRRRPPSNARAGLAIADPKERAMWRWANVENLDNFLKDVYDYFIGNGIWCIVLSRVLNLLTLAFVVGFSTFLTMCVDYKKIPESKTMSQIVIPKCTKNMSGSANLFIWLFSFLWIAKCFQYVVDMRRLRHLHDFYHHLLGVSDTDIQTISWQDVVGRLMALRDSNPTTADGVSAKQRRFMGNQSKQRMDAHDIANRLMRKENYLIALFNKDILDLTLPIPFLRNRQLFSKTMEWNLSLCILDYVFNQQGQVRPFFLRDTHRRALSEGLRRRFIFAGCMNVICAPFIVLYLVMLYFFRYFNEYKKNPSRLGSRQYTPLAEWKFREFNELWHLFQRRINMSYPFATRYIDQFPKDKTIQVSRFVALIAGAIVSVLAMATLIDPELFLSFEITPQRTVFFYLGVFGTIWAVSQGAVPEENLVFDPEYALNDVAKYTHYLPNQWQGRLHSNEVRKEFSMLYQMKVVIFLEEILSIIFTPFVLWFTLPKCSDRLVDFFREFTIHVDGLGYVCSFAVFDFKKGGAEAGGYQTDDHHGQGLRDEYFSTKDGKMLASYYGFLDNYATNPRGAPFMHSAQRPFHPPTGARGLSSSPFRTATNGPAGGREERPVRDLSRSTAVNLPGRSPRRGPRFGPTARSMMPSALLDPPTQSPASNFRNPSQQAGTSRFKSGRPPGLAEEPRDDDGLGLSHAAQGTSDISAGGVGEDSLGDSWKTTRAAAQEDDEDEDEDVGALTGEKGAGVLGLLYQFQKAQTEGRGTGVNI
ncbi:MAG: Golgi transport complex subunit 6 [Chaenotheca gracillima]|nr:MAG: Golgi transport complex subunit 6 [Chaenotheca gracillima]